jgi:preprotein translocase subunit Sec63
MSEEQSEYVGGLLLIGFMHRLYEEYVDSSVLWLLKKKKKKTDRRDIIAKQVGRSGSKLSDIDRSYTVKKSSSLTEDDNNDDDEEEEEEESHLSVD